jgi:hypothetical protein
MTAPGRLATALAVVAVSVALPFARTPAEPAHPVPTVSFSAMGLSFRYPATWHAETCLSTPNLPQQEAQISAMLHTVQIASGDLVRPRTSVGHAAPGRGVMNPAALPTMYLV